MKRTARLSALRGVEIEKDPTIFLISEVSEKGKYHFSDNNGRNRDIFYEL